MWLLISTVHVPSHDVQSLQLVGEPRRHLLRQGQIGQRRHGDQGDLARVAVSQGDEHVHCVLGPPQAGIDGEVRVQHIPQAVLTMEGTLWDFSDERLSCTSIYGNL